MKDLIECRILVTATSYGKNDPRLFSELEQLVGKVIYNKTGKPLKSAELVGLLPGCDGYIAGLDTIDREALATADNLKVIARYGVGVDNVDLEAAGEKGVIVTNTPGANSVSVAELTLAFILSLARRLPEAIAATRRGDWPRLNSLSLEGKNVGLLGLGSIGKQVVQRLHGFDCNILAYEPFPTQDIEHTYGVKLLPLQEVLAKSDFVSLHLPLLPETRLMVNAQFLSMMKPHAYLVNTSRGELIDETALVEAIQSGHLSGAAIDVFSQEPPSPDNPLLHLPQVIVTPHCAAHTDGATDAMGWTALRDCLAVLSGEEPIYRVR